MSVAQSNAIKVDFRDSSWQRALKKALDLNLPVRWEDGVLLVACHGECKSAGWHRVDWSARGLTCDCPSRHPCHHRARAWCEWMSDWGTLVAIAHAHGAEAAVRWVVWQETGELDPTPIRPLRDVRLWRACGYALADVPHAVRHSPTGIEWGYGGSGPADLARSILMHFYGPAVAEALYQRFKWDVVARIPRGVREYVLPAEQIAGWVEAAAARAAA